MNFQPGFAEAIIEGAKTVTRRRMSPNPRSPWYRGECSIKVGRTYAVCPGRGKIAIAHVRVLAVDRVRLGDMSDTEAHREGVDSAALFEGVWRDINGSYDPQEWVYRVEFELVRG